MTTQPATPIENACSTADERPRSSRDQPVKTRTDASRRGLSRRSAWRQRLVEAEGGLRLGIRTDSTLFVHLFVICGIVAAGLVLGLGVIQWAIAVLAITVVLSAEMFNQMLRLLLGRIGHHLPDELRNAAKIGTTAVVTASVGAVVALLLVFGQCIAHLGD